MSAIAQNSRCGVYSNVEKTTKGKRLMTPILNHYFARINWSGAAAVNIDTLRALHLKHNCTIPFENLDVLLPREIQLDDQSLEEKLVIARRGGYCLSRMACLSGCYVSWYLMFAAC